MAKDNLQFEVMKANSSISINGTNYFMSVQKITDSDTKNSSEHFVLRKQGTNPDGSLRGQTKQIFLPIKDAPDVLKKAVLFLSD